MIGENASGSRFASSCILRKEKPLSNLILAVIKGIAEEAWNLELTSDHDYALIKSVKSAKGSRVTRGRALDKTEVGQLVNLCDSKTGLRNCRVGAILALGAGCGLRRAEIVGLRLD